jgi:hypothetical protein
MAAIATNRPRTDLKPALSDQSGVKISPKGASLQQAL